MLFTSWRSAASCRRSLHIRTCLGTMRQHRSNGMNTNCTVRTRPQYSVPIRYRSITTFQARVNKSKNNKNSPHVDCEYIRNRRNSYAYRTLATRATSSESTTPNVPATDPETATCETLETDILIVGGGIVGCALARTLRRQSPSLDVTVLEASSSGMRIAPDKPYPHPRSYALSPASLEILGLASFNPEPGEREQQSEKNRMGFYDSMQVWESSQPSFLLFTNQDLTRELNAKQLPYLGAVMEDATLQGILWDQLLTDCAKSDTMDSNANIFSTGSCRLLTNSKIRSIQVPSHGSQGLVSVDLQDSKSRNEDPSNRFSSQPSRIQAQLLVAADGSNSFVRNALQFPTEGFDYGQSALTFTVQLASPHHGRAFQRFLPSGPLALLPSFSPNHAVVVWSTSPEQAGFWKNQSDENPKENLTKQLNELLQQGPGTLEPLFHHSTAGNIPTPLINILYGLDKVVELFQYGPAVAALQESSRNGGFRAPPKVEAIVSPRFVFPLSCRQVTSYVQPRVALVGDAAHSVHPMAGQGLNLGLQDVANLADTIGQANSAGMDIATFLEDYNRSRLSQVSATLAGIHGLQQLFGAQQVWAKHAKSVGMNMIQNVPPLRQRLVQAACQGVLKD